MVNFEAFSPPQAFWLLRKTPDHEFKAVLEEIISKDASWSVRYAGFVIKGAWPPCEDVVKKNGRHAFEYALRAIKGRWLPGEKAIKKDPQWAYFYALDVVKGRWPDGEPSIMESAEYSFLYAKDIIKGRLPEVMHTAMTMLTFSDPENRWAKKYFSHKKYHKIKKCTV